MDMDIIEHKARKKLIINTLMLSVVTLATTLISNAYGEWFSTTEIVLAITGAMTLSLLGSTFGAISVAAPIINVIVLHAFQLHPIVLVASLAFSLHWFGMFLLFLQRDRWVSKHAFSLN